MNHDEMDRNYLPELKESNLDISGYDTVFVGYPIWLAYHNLIQCGIAEMPENDMLPIW